MEEQVNPLSSAIKACGHIREQQATTHPDMETLADYHDGLLGEELVSDVQTHLSTCKSCVKVLLSFDSVTQQDWDYSENHQESTYCITKIEKNKRWPLSISPQTNLFFAALFIIGFVIFSLLLSKKFFFNQELNAPTSETIAILDLLPDNFQNRNVSSSSSLNSIDSSYNTMFFLNISGQAPMNRYFGRIFSQGSLSESIWEGTLKPTDYQIIPLLIPKSFLEPGSYEVKIYQNELTDEALLTYRFSIIEKS